MTAEKVMDVIARLSRYNGQAIDAISADAQVNMDDAPSLLQILDSECPRCQDTSIHDTNGQKSWENIEDSSGTS